MLERNLFHELFSNTATKWYQIAMRRWGCQKFDHPQVALFNPSFTLLEMESAFSIILSTTSPTSHGQYFKKMRDSFWNYPVLTDSILSMSVHSDFFGSDHIF